MTADLADRIEQAEGASYDLTLELVRRWPLAACARELATLDAAVAFVERVLPGSYWLVDSDCTASVHGVSEGKSPGDDEGKRAATPAMALVAAALRALAADLAK